MKKCRYLMLACLCVLPFLSFKQQDIPKDAGRRLMIVAHPDDETIFFGNELSKGGYVVVCLTNGDNIQRSQEFKKLIEDTGNYGVIWNYPDKTLGRRDSWDHSRDSIRLRLETVIRGRKWEKIVTHGPRGEYGHAHHQMTSYIVASIVEENHMRDRLYCSGPYYSKRELSLRPLKPAHDLDQKQLSHKERLLSRNYPSQKKVADHLHHYLPYERLIPYPYPKNVI